MNEQLREQLSKQYGHLVGIVEETVEHFGEERAFWGVELANDWIDLRGALSQAYPGEELLTSLVCADFMGLFMALHRGQHRRALPHVWQGFTTSRGFAVSARSDD